MTDFVMTYPAYLVGQTLEVFGGCIAADIHVMEGPGRDGRTVSAVAVFDEECLAQRWRDERCPGKQVIEVSEEQLCQYIRSACQADPSVTQVGVNPTTEAVEGSSRCYCISVTRFL